MSDAATHIDTCQSQIRVQYYECDPMGYLHHSRYFQYFEQGRTELLRRQGLAYSDMERQGQRFFVVARAGCKYIRPARYDQVLTLTTRLERVTRARIDHAYEVHHQGLLLCTGQTTLACVDAEGRLAEIPEFLLPKKESTESPSGLLRCFPEGKEASEQDGR